MCDSSINNGDLMEYVVGYAKKQKCDIYIGVPENDVYTV